MAVAQLLQHPAHAAWRRRHLQRERNRPIRQRLEAKIVAALEELEDLRQAFIDRLDALSIDPDLEDDGLFEDPADDEPYLSAAEALNQRFWSYGYCGDLEGEHDGREPDPVENCDWPDEGGQTRDAATPDRQSGAPP